MQGAHRGEPCGCWAKASRRAGLCGSRNLIGRRQVRAPPRRVWQTGRRGCDSFRLGCFPPSYGHKPGRRGDSLSGHGFKHVSAGRARCRHRGMASARGPIANRHGWLAPAAESPCATMDAAPLSADARRPGQAGRSQPWLERVPIEQRLLPAGLHRSRPRICLSFPESALIPGFRLAALLITDNG